MNTHLERLNLHDAMRKRLAIAASCLAVGGTVPGVANPENAWAQAQTQPNVTTTQTTTSAESSGDDSLSQGEAVVVGLALGFGAVLSVMGFAAMSRR